MFITVLEMDSKDWSPMRTPPRNTNNQYLDSSSKGSISPNYINTHSQRDLSPNTAKNIANKSNFLFLKKYILFRTVSWLYKKKGQITKW